MNERIEVTEILFLFLYIHYLLWTELCHPPPPQIHVEILTPEVSVFGDGTFKLVIRLNVVIRLGP